MKVLFVSNDPKLFEEGSAVRARMRFYAAHMEELHIVSSAPFSAREEAEGNLYLYPVHAGRVFRIFSLAQRARRIIRERGIDVVSAQDPFELGLAALRAVRGTSAKLHVQVHTDFLSLWFVKSGNWRSPTVHMPLLNHVRRRLADRVLPNASGIRVVSQRIKASLVERYGSRIPEPSVIAVMVDAAAPSPVPLPPHPSFTFALITVGRLEPEKRVEDILAALQFIAPRYPSIGLFVVGEGRERRRLTRLARSFGIEEKVIFLGERSDARGLMASAQAYIQASAYEGYGRTLIEAALAKVPIVTTDVGIVGEVFKGYDDVLSVPVADPTNLAYSIIGLIEDTAVRSALPLHAEATARAHLAAAGDIPKKIAEDLEQAKAR